MFVSSVNEIWKMFYTWNYGQTENKFKFTIKYFPQTRNSFYTLILALFSFPLLTYSPRESWLVLAQIWAYVNGIYRTFLRVI